MDLLEVVEKASHRRGNYSDRAQGKAGPQRGWPTGRGKVIDAEPGDVTRVKIHGDQSSRAAERKTPNAAPADSMKSAPLGPGKPENPKLKPSGKSHLRLGNRKGILIATGSAVAAGGGGLAYTRAKRKPEGSVSKLFDPFEGVEVEVGKADEPSGSSVGRKVTATIFPGPHGLIAGKKGKKLRAGGRGFAESTAGSLPGAAVAIAGARRGNAKMALGGAIGAQVGNRAAALHANSVNERKGYLKPVGKAMDAGSVTTGRLVHASHLRNVAPITPSGPGVSHVNDLSVTRNHKRKQPLGSQLALYRSGSESAMTGGGQTFGNRATHVRKSFDDLGATRSGRRGTPMSDIAQSGRVGHRVR